MWARLAVLALAASPPVVFAAPAVSTSKASPRLVPGLVLKGHTTKAMVLRAGSSSLDGRSNAPAITVLSSTAWSPDDPARDAAGELAVLLEVGRMLKSNTLAGLVGVGGQNGAFAPSAETALTRAVCMGLPVVKLSSNPSAARSGLFIETHGLAPEAAEQLLADCLLQLGALPPAANPAQPSAKELDRLREKIAAYQRRFDLAVARGFEVVTA